MAKSRSTASLTLQLGPIPIEGGLHTVQTTESKKATQFKSVCPTCDGPEPVPVNTRYVCQYGHGPFETTQVLKAKVDPDSDALFFAGTAEEVKEVKAETEIEKGLLNINTHLASDVDANTIAAGKTYVFLPKKESEAFDALLELLDEDGTVAGSDGNKLALVGEVNIRDTVNLMRITKRHGQVVLDELVRPEAMKEFPAHASEVTERNLSLFRTLLTTSVEDFDPEVYRDDLPTRLARFLTAKADGAQVTEIAPVPKKKDSDSMAALLEAAIAAKAA